MKNNTAIFILLMMIFTSNASAKPNIVATITPIASLAAMLTKDKANIIILNNSSGCPHEHSIKPSDKLALENAEMVIYIDEDFDSLTSLILRDYKGKKVKISDFTSINFKGEGGAVNWHFWLDLENVKAMHNNLAASLIQHFPEMKADIEQNLSESLIVIQKLEKLKQTKLASLAPVVLLSDSLEHFFKSLNISQFKNFQTTNTSLKNMQKLDNGLKDSSVKCIILDMEQNPEPYVKYDKVIIQLDSENWNITDEKSLNAESLITLFSDKYSKIIDQLSGCK